MALTHLIADLHKKKNPQQAKRLQSFFKTQKGSYGEGDQFWGLMVPQQREIIKHHYTLTLAEISRALKNPVHEIRFSVLQILVHQYKIGTASQKEKIYKLYIANARRVNNWDLVDLTAPQIVGDYLLEKPRKILYTFAQSHNLWEKRIAILSTLTFIGHKQYEDTLRIARTLLRDPHDLIHKAVGWMLREVGKKDKKTLETFLRAHAHHMPRTMLRYAIEKFPARIRSQYLQQKIHG